MPSRGFKTLLKLKFAGTRVGVRSHVGVRFTRVPATVDFTARLGAARRRMIYAPIRTCMVDVVSALSLRDGAALEARMG